MADNLRPTSFDEYIGQQQVKDNLQVFIEAAKRKNSPLEHVLLAGNSGCGKTSLAHLIAKAMGKDFRLVVGTSLRKPSQLAQLLSLKEGDILFIDEIHGIVDKVQDAFLLALEDFKINLMDPTSKEIMAADLARFTCIGATTELGLLSRPLRERFGIVETLSFLKEEDIVKLLWRSAKILGVPVDEESLKEIAKRSRGTPRVANMLLRRIADFATVKEQAVNAVFVNESARKLGIDSLGLNKIDRRLLRVLARRFNGGPVGLSSLATILDENIETLTTVCEPFLIKKGLLMRTGQGRKLTERGREYVAQHE